METATSRWKGWDGGKSAEYRKNLMGQLPVQGKTSRDVEGVKLIM